LTSIRTLPLSLGLTQFNWKISSIDRQHSKYNIY
jgi:hypothetical protein